MFRSLISVLALFYVHSALARPVVVYIDVLEDGIDGWSTADYRADQAREVFAHSQPDRFVHFVKAKTVAELKSKLSALLAPEDVVHGLVIDGHGGNTDGASIISVGGKNSDEKLVFNWDSTGEEGMLIANNPTAMAFSGLGKRFADDLVVLFGSCNLLQGDSLQIHLQSHAFGRIIGFKSAYLYANRMIGRGQTLFDRTQGYRAQQDRNLLFHLFLRGSMLTKTAAAIGLYLKGDHEMAAAFLLAGPVIMGGIDTAVTIRGRTNDRVLWEKANQGYLVHVEDATVKEIVWASAPEANTIFLGEESACEFMLQKTRKGQRVVDKL